MGGNWMKQGVTLSKFVVASPTVVHTLSLSARYGCLFRCFFPHPPLRLAGICQLSGTESPIIDKCLVAYPLYPLAICRESGCVFYPIGVIPHVAAGSPKTIICLFVSAKLFPDLKILQIFIAEISSP